MNILNILDGIPIVGQVKGFCHYAVGDWDAGNTALLKSTRATVVIGAGAVGMMGGPAVAVAAASSAGLLTDTVTSFATDKPHGIISNFEEVGSDIGNGNVPVASLLKTTINLGFDAMGGLGAAGLVKSLAQETGKTAGKEIAKRSIKKVIVEKLCNPVHVAAYVGHQYASGERQTPKTADDERDPSKESDPNDPRKPSDNKVTRQLTDKELEILMRFLKHFKATWLDEVCIRGRYPFRDLSVSQVKYLLKVLQAMADLFPLEKLLAVVVKVLDGISVEDVTFVNFLSLSELTMVCHGDWATHQNQVLSTTSQLSRSERRQKIEELWSQKAAAESVLQNIRKIRKEIQACDARLLHPFRDLYANIYHFWKHRFRPDGIEMSLAEYFGLINVQIKEMQRDGSFKLLQNGATNQVRMEMYLGRFGRRFRVVLKRAGNLIVLATAYFVDRHYPNDKDGDPPYFDY